MISYNQLHESYFYAGWNVKSTFNDTKECWSFNVLLN